MREYAYVCNTIECLERVCMRLAASHIQARSARQLPASPADHLGPICRAKEETFIIIVTITITITNCSRNRVIALDQLQKSISNNVNNKY